MNNADCNQRLEYPKIIAHRTAVNPVSGWTEYLRLSCTQDGKAKLQICQYEVLAEYDADIDVSDWPTLIDGKNVVGVEDGFYVGGDCKPISDWEREYSYPELPAVINELKALFHLSPQALDDIQLAAMSEEQQEILAWQKHRQRQAGHPGKPNPQQASQPNEQSSVGVSRSRRLQSDHPDE